MQGILLLLIIVVLVLAAESLQLSAKYRRYLSITASNPFHRKWANRLVLAAVSDDTDEGDVSSSGENEGQDEVDSLGTAIYSLTRLLTHSLTQLLITPPRM